LFRGSDSIIKSSNGSPIESIASRYLEGKGLDPNQSAKPRKEMKKFPFPSRTFGDETVKIPGFMTKFLVLLTTDLRILIMFLVLLIHI
jgi:hypothetical protein